MEKYAYMKKPDEDILELIALSESYSDVEIIEPPKQSRDDWLKARKNGIGGSDAAAICGLDQYRTPLDVYLDKIGQGGDDRGDNRNMKRGRKLEQIVAEEYLERHPEDLLLAYSQQVHPRHQWMIGNVDRIISSPRHTKKGRGILEIKVPARYSFDKIRLEGIPANYILQMQHYLAVTGFEWGTFAIFNADKWELMLVEVERDQGVIDTLIKVEEKFWNEHVVPRIPPKGKKEVKIELPKTDSQIKDMAGDDKFFDAIGSFLYAQDQIRGAEALAEAAKAKLLDTVNQEPGVYETESYRVYYTKVDGRKTFDKKALANAKPIDRLTLASTMAMIYDHGQGFEEAWSVLKHELESGRCNLNLDDFEKKGNDFLTLRIFPHKREQE